MDDCKSAERKHNWLGVAANWHLTLAPGPREERSVRLQESVTPSSGVTVNDDHRSDCRE